jgi:hypothetical protein
MWRYREACIEVKLSHEGRMAFSDASISSWTIMPLGLSGSSKYLSALLEMCNSSINKVEASLYQPSLQHFIYLLLLSGFPPLLVYC